MSVLGATGSLIGMGVAAASPTSRALRQDYRKDAEKLKTGAFGLTDAQKEQMQANAQSQAALAQQQQNAQLAQMIAQNPSMGGKALQAQGQIAQAGALARSQTATQVNQYSQQLAEQQRSATQQRIAQRAQQNLQTGALVGGKTGDVVGQLGGMVAGQFLPAFGQAVQGATANMANLTPEQQTAYIAQLSQTNPVLAQQIQMAYAQGGTSG